MTKQQIDVEVVYARELSQALIEVKGPSGMTLSEGIERSGILARFPEIDIGVNKVGIFGKVAKLDHPLHSGDRVEIYPPLIADPKQVRKKRAAATGRAKRGPKSDHAK